MGIKTIINQAANLTISAINKASDITFEKFDGASDRLNTAIDELKTTVADTSTSVIKAAKIGAGFAAFKFCSDVGVSWYRAIQLTRTANNATDAFKAVSENTIKTEDEIVNVLKNTRVDLKASASQFTEDVHKMGQNFGHLSAEISGSVNKASGNFGYMTQDIASGKSLFHGYLSFFDNIHISGISSICNIFSRF